MAGVPLRRSGTLEDILPAARDFTADFYILIADKEYLGRGKPHYDTHRSGTLSTLVSCPYLTVLTTKPQVSHLWP